jgi:hypothetical protein
MNKTYYVAVQAGVYRHDIVGVSDNEYDVHLRGVEAILEEEDKYHHIEIVRVNGNEEEIVDLLRWSAQRNCIYVIRMDKGDR